MNSSVKTLEIGVCGNRRLKLIQDNKEFAILSAKYFCKKNRCRIIIIMIPARCHHQQFYSNFLYLVSAYLWSFVFSWLVLSGYLDILLRIFAFILSCHYYNIQSIFLWKFLVFCSALTLQIIRHISRSAILVSKNINLEPFHSILMLSHT